MDKITCEGCGRGWSLPAPDNCPECGHELTVPEAPVDELADGASAEETVAEEATPKRRLLTRKA